MLVPGDPGDPGDPARSNKTVRDGKTGNFGGNFGPEKSGTQHFAYLKSGFWAGRSRGLTGKPKGEAFTLFGGS